MSQLLLIFAGGFCWDKLCRFTASSENSCVCSYINRWRKQKSLSPTNKTHTKLQHTIIILFPDQSQLHRKYHGQRSWVLGFRVPEFAFSTSPNIVHSTPACVKSSNMSLIPSGQENIYVLWLAFRLFQINMNESLSSLSMTHCLVCGSVTHKLDFILQKQSVGSDLMVLEFPDDK